MSNQIPAKFPASPFSPGSWGRDALIVALLCGAFFGFMLGSRPLSVPDEGRYAEIPREMAARGDYLTPRLNGVKYFEKPVLFYWLESAAIRLFGLSEWSLRLWAALFALLGCLAVYGAGRKLYGRTTGLIAAAVLATCPLYYAMSRDITLDMPVTALLTLSLLSFLIGTHEPEGLKRRLYLWGFYACAALATLTKGLIGILIPGMAVFAWIALLGQWRMLKELYLPSGIALFLLIAAPWHILVSRANPEFFNFYFVREHFQRYLTKIHHHYRAFWFFIPVLMLGMFPWIVFLFQSLKHGFPGSWRERYRQGDALFLMLWAGLVFLFFSASSSKLIPYILPVLPPLALLVGRYLAAASEKAEISGIKAGYDSFLILSLVLAGMLTAFTLPDSQRLGLYTYVPSLVLAAGGVAAWLLKRWHDFKKALILIAVSAALFLVVLNAAAPLIDTRSVKTLALTLKPLLEPTDEVATYHTYYQDLPVYIERRITVVEWKGELEFGTTIEDTCQWMIDETAFWRRWQSPATVYMLTGTKRFEELRRDAGKKLYVLAKTGEDVLITNKEMKQ